MPLEGFGSEMSVGAIVLVALKVARDYLKERGERKHAIKVVNGNRDPSDQRRNANPGKGGNASSTNLVLHVLEEHGEKLHKLTDDVTAIKINLAEVNTRCKLNHRRDHRDNPGSEGT